MKTKTQKQKDILMIYRKMTYLELKVSINWYINWSILNPIKIDQLIKRDLFEMVQIFLEWRC